MNVTVTLEDSESETLCQIKRLHSQKQKLRLPKAKTAFCG
jgi:hypothetical protein